jgi:ABC-type transport system involved in cytochrome c biogenesis permease subunit
MKIFILFTLLAGFLFATPSQKKNISFDKFNTLAIQDRGRFKPIDTFARESILFLVGKSNYQGFTPTAFVFELFLNPQAWENEPFLKVNYLPLKKALHLNETQDFFSPVEIRSNIYIQDLLREINQKEQQKEKLNSLEKKALELQNKLGLYHGVITGRILTVVPDKSALSEPWGNLHDLPQIAPNLVEDFKKIFEAYKKDNGPAFIEASNQFISQLKTVGPYPSEQSLKLEIQYNSFRPFRVAWIFYLIGCVLFILFFIFHKTLFKKVGLATLILGLGVHIYGFTLRCLISGRPPVTNMYESVIWVALGCMVFGFIIWLAYKNFIILTAASVFSWVALVLADNLPSVLDPGIHPLEPVLRSNFWLTIHVLTITLSYAAFALSLCLGNVVLGSYLIKSKQKVETLVLYMYRAVQIGVVLLAAGTILGGVWADYSWGRFWGWDPKEVWALIALLLYLAVLHGRFTGWLKGFGFAVVTVFSFLGVLMAWYGVNFVLGVGLHSYGFGSGGMGYVLAYVIAQTLFILAAYLKYKKTI